MEFSITTDVDASGLNERYLAQEAAGLKRRSEEQARATD